MKKKKLSNNDLIAALLSLIIGVLFIIKKGSILSIMMTVLGVVLIIFGILDIYHKKTTNGLIKVVIGAVIIVCGWTIVDLILIVLGVLLIIWGIMNIRYINKKNLFTTLKVICALILGVLLIIGKWVFVDWLFIIIGVIFVINGIIILLGK